MSVNDRLINEAYIFTTRLVCTTVSESNISFIIHPHHMSAYSVPINGGLTLTRGIQSYLSRHRIVYISAAVLVVTIIMQAVEEKPRRQGSESSGSEGGGDMIAAQNHWRQKVQKADDGARETFFSNSEIAQKK